MAGKERADFCIMCRKDTEYRLEKKTIAKKIKDKNYRFSVTAAICLECGGEMSIPGLVDKNIREVDEQYRAAEGLVTIDDIEKLMENYKIGKAPLSLALGFGEVTIARYLAGQVPSREYSDIMRRALVSPAYMKELLIANREKIAGTAYNKAMAAASGLSNIFSVSGKMLKTISYIFERLEEVTPLTLQKLLYFIQGVYLALYDSPLFDEDCEAWIHGPVYRKVYELFRDFKYSPIDDARFAVFANASHEWVEGEREVIDLVVNTFGIYGGKALERITHNESPWQDARKGYGDGIPSNETMKKDSIKAYYTHVNERYGIGSEKGLKNYIYDMLGKPVRNLAG